MNTKIPTFNPDAPEAFEPLSSKEQYALRESDPEASAAYEAEMQKQALWAREQRLQMMQKPNPVFARDSVFHKNAPFNRYDRIERDTAERLHTLAGAIAEHGFTVKYAHNPYTSGDEPVHWTWAKRMIILKDGQEVGYVKAWSPGYRSSIEGWVISTNRGVGNPNARWGDERSIKRLKKLESAVNWIKDTAIPEAPYEADIKELEEQINAISRSACNLRSAISKYRRGEGEYHSSSDGFLEGLLKLREEGNLLDVARKLDERIAKIAELETQERALQDEINRIRTDQLNPLLEKARAELPDFY